METPEQILLIQTAFLGDVVLTLPLVEAVHSLWPDAELDFLVRASYAGFLQVDGRISHVIPYDKHNSHAGMRGMFRMADQLRQRRYDLVLLPHRSFRSGLLARLAGIPKRIGFKGVAGSMWYTESVVRDKAQHEGQRNLALLDSFKDQANAAWSPRPQLNLNDSLAVDEVERWMDTVGFPRGKRIVALAPGSVWATKRWPEEHWNSLLSKLSADSSLMTVLVGGPEDHDLCIRVRDVLSSRVYIAAGELTVQGSAALIQQADLLITGDTGPLHLAQAVNTRTLAIFGPTVPEFGFAPTGDSDRIVGLDLPCRPCAIHGSRECPLRHHHCMRWLNADRVWSVAQQMLADYQSQSSS